MRPSRISILALVACLAVTPILAQQSVQGDFTFKRVKPPGPGQGKRITVQIEPQAAQPTVAATAAVPATPTQGRYQWFWTANAPELEASSPGRLAAVLQSLQSAPEGQGVAAPRLDEMLSLARTHGAPMLLHTVNTRVSPALVLAVASVESGGRSDAVSAAGAEGLMQLIPATADRFGVTDAMDVSQNIRGGVAYLDWLLREFEDDPILALAAYNAGENAVRSHGGVPPFAETRNYVPKVLAAFAVARSLCRTPPELISDGCVFNLGS